MYVHKEKFHPQREACKLSAMENKIYKGAAKLLFGTLGSRILGFVREILAAKFVGGGHGMDIFTTAYRIPNLLRGILGEKACESAFLPVYKSLKATGKSEEAEQVSGDTFKILILLLIAFTAILVLTTPFVVSLMGNGFKNVVMDGGKSKFSEAVKMTRFLMPLTILIGFFSFLGAKMLAKEKFATYALAPVISNIIAIIVIVFTHKTAGYFCLAWGVTAGALSQCFFFWILTTNKFSIFGKHIFSIDFSNINLRKAGKLWIPITFGSGLEKVGTIVETQMASFLGKGAITSLYYANLINLLSFSILGLSFNRSVIPHMTEQAAKSDYKGFSNTILSGIRVNFILLLPVACFVMILREPIIELLLQHGKFDSSATQRTAIALFYYSIGLVAMGLMGLFSRSFYALLNAKTPIKISAFTLCINVGLNFILWKTPLRHAGLALSASISFWINALILFFILNFKLKKLDNQIKINEVFSIVWRTAVSSLALVFVVLYMWPILTSFINGSYLFVQIIRMAIITTMAGITFAVSGWILGIKEFKQLGNIVIK